ncbi:MAG: DUF2812 domain-containing protein [Clostridia bacterium]|nr:DUF2812 domain-containing protein [Clostridia bacterium]
MKKEKNNITKFRLYATIDREEAFLNEMCAAGWKPVRIILGAWFQFEKCRPGEYIARVTTCIDPKGHRAGKQRRQQLSEILIESGAEIIPETNIDAGTRIYAVRKAELGEFEINTDIDSLISEYTGRRRYHITLGALLLAFFVLCACWGCSMIHEYRLYPDEAFHLTSACIEFVCAAIELLCSLVLLIPVPKYSRKINELRSQREIEE